MLFDSRIRNRLTTICLLALLAGCATVPESVEVSEVVEIAATVTAIDQARRLVTVRGPAGNELTLEASSEVRNLAQVQVGNIVRLSYEQIYMATRVDPSEMSSNVTVLAGAVQAESGESPGAAVGSISTMTVRVESVGPEGRSVTYTAPDGLFQSIDVRQEEAQAFARSLRPGEILRLTFIEALALIVDPLGE